MLEIRLTLRLNGGGSLVGRGAEIYLNRLELLLVGGSFGVVYQI